MSAIQQLLAVGAAATPPGQVLITSTQYWVCPAGVTSISVVAVGLGGTSGGASCGGGGGALVYRNKVSVIPGNSYQITVGTGYPNYVTTAFGMIANAGADGDGGGAAGIPQGTFTAGFYGGNGNGPYPNTAAGGGGGGAGGYSGNGGAGGNSAGTSGGGAGGAGGGGGGSSSGQGGRGGGVGLLGAGTSGGSVVNTPSGTGVPGKPGSGGVGGDYGGGGGGRTTGCGAAAVRIIWPGDVRQFPSTRTADE